MCLTISSPAFFNGATMPKRFTCDGENVSPPLHWRGLPNGTKELALVCEDPDAPTSPPWVHWLVYKIPVQAEGLPERLPSQSTVKTPIKLMQGLNSWTSKSNFGYRGPAPPPQHGIHHYHFKLYALSRELDLQPGIDKAALANAMDGHILAESELIGTYKR